MEKQIDNSGAMLSRIAEVYTNGFLSDVSLVVNGCHYPAHRLILSAASSVFHVLLMSPSWSEANMAAVVLKESEQCASIFNEFLHYLYTGYICLNCDTVMGFLILSDKYDVKDLLKVSIDYMCSHIAHAGACNKIVTWMQYTQTCGHIQVAEECKKFIKWNIELVASTEDFANFEPDVFVALLQENDIVVVDEMSLYKIAVSWLQIQQDSITAEAMNVQSNEVQADHIARYQVTMEELTKTVMSHIRFPMMSPRQLAELLLSDLVNRYKDFFMGRMAIGMAFHSGQKSSSRIHNALNAPTGRLLFTPRQYTSDVYSSMLSIERLGCMPAFHSRTLVFSSRIGCSYARTDHQQMMVDRGGDEHTETAEWVVDVYPKGVWFRKSFLINWQGTVEVPEHVLRTVRISVTCRDPTGHLRVKVGILLIGVKDNVEHVASVIEKTHCFDENNEILNIDDVMDYDSLNTAYKGSCPFLVGPLYDSLRFHIVIGPLSKFSISPTCNTN